MKESGSISEDDIRFMNRAIEIARNGDGNVAPNPMVGAVIVARGRIIGEGFHRRFGGPHAEVNAVASVSTDDECLLPESTVYVTLEPCSHYGKTPPCSLLLLNKCVKRVVVGTRDPNPKVDGGGIKMLRDAGVRVDICDGELSQRCRDIDPRFFIPLTLKRPYVTLKWAQGADGYMAGKDGKPIRFSTPLTTAMTHRLRGLSQAILTSGKTVASDNPRLDTRFFPSATPPLPVIVDPSGQAPADATAFKRQSIYFTTASRTDLPATVETIRFETVTIRKVLDELMRRGISSVLVEAGPTLLNSFISSGLWDVTRVEISPANAGCEASAKAPSLPGSPFKKENIDGNTILFIRNNCKL